MADGGDDFVLPVEGEDELCQFRVAREIPHGPVPAREKEGGVVVGIRPAAALHAAPPCLIIPKGGVQRIVKVHRFHRRFATFGADEVDVIARTVQNIPRMRDLAQIIARALARIAFLAVAGDGEEDFFVHHGTLLFLQVPL